MKVCGNMVVNMALAKKLGQTMLGLKEIMKTTRSMVKEFYF